MDKAIKHKMISEFETMKSIEQDAHDFYLRAAKDPIVTDPAIAKKLTEVAADEANHVQIVDRITYGQRHFGNQAKDFTRAGVKDMTRDLATECWLHQRAIGRDALSPKCGGPPCLRRGNAKCFVGNVTRSCIGRGIGDVKPVVANRCCPALIAASGQRWNSQPGLE